MASNGAERMAPPDWGRAVLSDCIVPERPICYGILKPGKGHPGGVPVVKVKDIKGGRILDGNLLLTAPEIDEAYRRSRLKAGDVLLSIRGTTGRLAVVPSHLENANITQDTARISVAPHLDREFIFYSLQSSDLQRQIADQTRGQAVKGINIRDVRLLRLLVPPLPEQRKIAAILSSVDEAIEATQAVIDQVQVVKKGLMQELLTKGLPGRHKKFKQTEIGQIPEDWEVVELQKCLDTIIDYRGKTPPKSGAGISLLSAANVGLGYIKETPRQYISEEDYRAWTTYGFTRPGDVLITTEAPVGHVAPYPTAGTYQIGRRVMALRPNTKMMSSRFLLDVLLSDDVQSRLLERNRGSTVPRVLKPDITTLPIPVPPRDEQQEIAEGIEAIERNRTTLQHSLVAHRRLKTALMSVLLTGELRVQPDPPE